MQITNTEVYGIEAALRGMRNPMNSWHLQDTITIDKCNMDELEHHEYIDNIINSDVFIGPNDLSCDYDCMGDTEKIKELISVISKECVKNGKHCGIITTDKGLIKHALLCGCSMVSYGSEINMLIKGAREITNEKYL